MASGGTENLSDEIITVRCSVCSNKDIQREADKYCVQCQDYYCVPCTDMHKMFPAMSRHQLLDKSDFNSYGLQTTKLPDVPTERCSVHTTKLLDMYCRNHDEVVCATCVALSHKTCQDIHSISENADILYNQTAFGETSQNLKATKKTTLVIKQANEHLLSVLKKSKERAIDSIMKFKNEMEAIIAKLAKQSIKEVEAAYITMSAELQKEISEAEKDADDLEQKSTKFEKSSGNKAQEFVCIKIAEKTISKFEERNKLKSTRAPEIVFLVDTKVQNFLQQVSSLGQVSTSYKPKSTVYVLKGQKKLINVKLPEDRRSFHIFGSCFTSNGCLLLTDINNKKLRRVAMSTASVKDHVAFDASPSAVCQIARAEAAVSLANQTVHFVSLDGKMITTRHLKFDHNCFGLASWDEKMYISDRGSAVYIYDMSGALMRQIKTDQSGNAIFGSSMNISLSKFGNRVYVADEIKGLVTLDIHGNYESTFTDPELVKPVGVCTDGRGNIFLCGMFYKVVQGGEISKKKFGVIGHGIYSYSVCFDPRQNILALTTSDNNVHVYELE